MWQSNGAALAEQCVLDGKVGDECKLSTKLLKDFSQTNLFWLAMVCAALMLSNYFRAARWKDMLHGVGYDVSVFNSFAAIMVGYFANLGVPRSGEILRPTILAKYESVSIDKAFGTIVLERIVDVILFAFMVGLGFVFHYDKLLRFISENLPYETSSILLFLGGLMVLGLIGLFLLVKLLKADTTNDSAIVAKIKGLINGFLEGLGSIRKLPNLPKFIFQSIAIWALYFLMHYMAFWAFVPTELLGWKDAIFVFDFGSLGIILPSPGGMGTYHYLVEESLNMLGIPRLDGFSFAMIIFFTLNVGCNAVFGLLSLISLPLVNKK